MNHTLTATTLLALAGIAHAQDALGGGRALDRGLNQAAGGRINATTQDLRGILRYGATGGSPLGGPPSAIGIRSIRPTSPVADAINRGLIRDQSFINRSGINPTPTPAAQPDRVAQLEAGRLPAGPLTSNVSLPQRSGLRSLTQRSDPSVGYVTTQEGGVYVARSSALRGIELYPANRVDLSVSTKAGEKRTGTAETYGRVMDEVRRATLSRALNPGTNPTAPATNPNQPAPAAKPVPTPDQPLQYDPEATLQRLRDRLLGGKRTTLTDTTQPAGTDRRDDGPASTLKPAPLSGAGEGATEDDIKTLRAMTLKLDTYVPAGASDAAAADGYTRLGQEALAGGKFGLAEQMFSAALTRSPSNPLAQAGKIHADMGLGLLMSAGADLRSYFIAHPEMIPIRFDTTLLIPKGRAEQLVKLLETDLSNTNGPLLSNAGLTLAYLGRQYDNPLWLSKGLSDMQKQGATDPQTAGLHEVLTKVWLIDPLAPAQADELTK